MKWFISDLHLFSPETIRDYVRPFTSIEVEYNTFLNNIQARVKSEDDLYIIGDYFDYHQKRASHYEWAWRKISGISGKKHLILGNNETRLIQEKFKDFDSFKSWCLMGGFSSVHETGLLINMLGRDFYCVHDPKDYRPGVVNLYGHLHHSGALSAIGINVSCDAIGFRPISEEDIKALLDLYKNYIYLNKSSIPLCQFKPTYKL